MAILRDTTTTHAVLWVMDKDQYLALIESPEFLLYVEAAYERAWRLVESERVARAIAAALKMVAEKAGY